MSSENFFYSQVVITSLDMDELRVSAKLIGDHFQRGVHTQGTEVKAITYSGMRIEEAENTVGVLNMYVVLDI